MSDSFEKIAEDALMDEYDYCEEFDLDYGDESFRPKILTRLVTLPT